MPYSRERQIGPLDFLDRYDRPETMFYLDPPYFGSEGDYGKECSTATNSR